ncbi:MAG TPA: NDP-sugar synthase [Acidimicrobiales bacterium]|nr:NDP-sugar synthase [Acidimicrobiales bacterium]
MKAVVLVGGEGTRLRPLTFTTPKQLLPVAEMTMIERVVGHLAFHGVDDVVLSMGYRPDAFLSMFPDNRCAGVPLRYAVEPTPLDTAGAIRFAADDAGIDSTFLVVNGDVLTAMDLTALMKFHRLNRGEATISLVPAADPSRFGVVPTDADGRVTAFIEKPPADEAPTNLVNAGTYVIEPAVLRRIPTDRRVSIERETFPQLVTDGSLFALGSTSYWIDAGTPAEYLRANLDLVAGVWGASPASGARSVGEGAWHLGRPVVDADSTPGSLIGDAAFVGRKSEVRDSVIGAGARVEDALVSGSVVLPGAVVHRDAEVTGSILGAGAVVGRGAVVSGLAVVGDGVRVQAGVHLDGVRMPAA